MATYRYFISYVFRRVAPGQVTSGPGNRVVDLPAPIRGADDIQALQRWICRTDGNDDVAITSYQLMTAPTCPTCANSKEQS